MASINIEGVGDVDVDESFFSLSPEDQNKTVDEIVAAQPQSKSSDKPWYIEGISDVTGTVGSALLGLGGAAAGTFAAPGLGTAVGGVTGSTIGGALGGGFGEWIEQKLSGEETDTGEIIDTGVTEGLWGLVPGAGGLLTRTGAKALGQSSKFTGKFFQDLARIPGLGQLGPAQLGKWASKKGQVVADYAKKLKPDELHRSYQLALTSAMISRGVKPKVAFKQASEAGDWKEIEKILDKIGGSAADKARRKHHFFDSVYTDLSKKAIKKGTAVQVAGKGLLAANEANEDDGYARGGMVGLMGRRI